jgi:hypothetical protein
MANLYVYVSLGISQGLEILATESSSGIYACGVDVRLQQFGAVHNEAGNKQVCYK